ncbi:MAG: DNA (cytosine-5-)-methyltransferase [Bacteroidales bacterium]|nr:DNA (cytosine-5-)-methyltransferase [Bacteroidales bacterium]
MAKHHIKVVELFAGVGGFRIGLEGASDAYETIWNNQWEPSTQHQDASLVYKARFGVKGHVNRDINLVKTDEIPDHDLLVGGFPCQDYSVAATLSRSGGIEGKKGVLWWQIYRILEEKGNKRPKYIFFENVDRLLNSPATQRGRDFAIILASLSDLGYEVEWRIINAADYGMPQRRRRTYIVGYLKNSVVAKKIEKVEDWVKYDGVMAQAFPFKVSEETQSKFDIEGTIQEVSANFNKGEKNSPFGNAGIMSDRHVYTVDAVPAYEGTSQMLGDILVEEDFVPEEFFISEEDLPRWQYEKGAKKINRVSKEGFEYVFSEGGMAFPDYLDKPSRTMITGEGGPSPSRFKHVVQTPSGRYRRLIPIEMERLNMFPDNHTYHPEVSDGRRAFLMGNALVCGIVQEIGRSLYRFIYNEAPISSHPIHMQRNARPVLTLDLFNTEEKELIYNKPRKTYTLDSSKRLFVGLVKKDNEEYFLNREPTKIYYTDSIRRFPSTIALNKLFYFMPYIKGKGVQDIYLIKMLRLGSKTEVYPETKKDIKAPRFVFELEYLESLPKYHMLTLRFQHAFTDTYLGRVLSQKENDIWSQ